MAFCGVAHWSPRCSEELKLPGEDEAVKNRACYNIEFTFDADTQVAITIYYQAMEEFHSGVPMYVCVCVCGTRTGDYDLIICNVVDFGENSRLQFHFNCNRSNIT